MKLKNSMKEEYRDIKDYEGLYQISNLGNVKSLDRIVLYSNGVNRLHKGRILKQSIASNGYLLVSLYSDLQSKVKHIHQLVAMSFLNHVPNGHKIIVDHKNNNKLDNNINNLQLITSRENLSKDKKGYTSKYTGVCWEKDRKKWVAHIRIKGKNKTLGYFTDEIKASEAYKLKLSTLCAV